MDKTVYLSLGSNLGQREQNLSEAIRRLSELGSVKRVSKFYQTMPMGITHQPWFLNCAVEMETKKMPRQLLAGLLAIERQMGRRRAAINKRGPRNIDIDILLLGNVIMDAPELTLPHPALHQRRFVLVPLAEIAGDAIHPVFK